ncbi:MAG: gephyrin-like molybdotransferase Glp [Actinomycetota bacterium]
MSATESLSAGGAPPAHRHVGTDLLPVDEAQKRVLDRTPTLAPIELHLPEAYGCVLAADVVAELDIPTFASSAMDGFAVRASDIALAKRDRPTLLRIVGQAPVGRHSDATVGTDEAVRIATGAPIPAGADCIVPIEYTTYQGEAVHVFRAFPEGYSVRPPGEDISAGSTLVPAGRRIAAPELGLLSSSGHASVLVYPRPRVVVLSTGDELVEPGRPAAFGMVRDANSYTLYGALKDAGAIPILGGIVRDEPEAMKEAVLSQIIRADVFISSGGVSVGERDVVKKAFFRRGEIDFYRVAMQPGMPQAFGQIEGVPYFGLPGNPVSVFVSFEIFVRPALLKMTGRKDLFRPKVEAVLETEITGPEEKVQFARVRVWRERGHWRAASTGPRGSNLLGTVAKANGLATIPVGTETAHAGEKVSVMLFRSLEDDR